MDRHAYRRPTQRPWRVFGARDGSRIEQAVREGENPCCPGCGGLLEARPGSRVLRDLPLGASAFDLDCRGCRRFWCLVRHTARSLRLIRMRRLVAAVRAVRVDAAAPPVPTPAPPPTAGPVAA